MIELLRRLLGRFALAHWRPAARFAVEISSVPNVIYERHAVFVARRLEDA